MHLWDVHYDNPIISGCFIIKNMHDLRIWFRFTIPVINILHFKQRSYCVMGCIRIHDNFRPSSFMWSGLGTQTFITIQFLTFTVFVLFLYLGKIMFSSCCFYLRSCFVLRHFPWHFSLCLGSFELHLLCISCFLSDRISPKIIQSHWFLLQLSAVGFIGSMYLFAVDPFSWLCLP